MNSKITGVGSYIPEKVTTNNDFKDHRFYDDKGETYKRDNESIIARFKSITGISERRYIPENLCTSDIATFAAEQAIQDSGIDKNDLDYIIVAHNYGDVRSDSSQSDTVPSLASRIKYNLQIQEPTCVAYDLLFGCPGWVEGLIQAHAFIKSGVARKCLVVGAEALSRVVDPHDRDSMIYSDGAGAVILESTEEKGGISAHFSSTYATDEAHFIYFGESNNLKEKDNRRYIKMYGRKIYKFALDHVPLAMKTCVDKSDFTIDQVKKIFIHQANEKMDEAIIERFYGLYEKPVPRNIMPMSIHNLGNSSVATIPTLYDLVMKNKLEVHSIQKGDVIIFASVGAGMNLNAIVYKV